MSLQAQSQHERRHGDNNVAVLVLMSLLTKQMEGQLTLRRCIYVDLANIQDIFLKNNTESRIGFFYIPSMSHKDKTMTNRFH